VLKVRKIIDDDAIDGPEKAKAHFGEGVDLKASNPHHNASKSNFFAARLSAIQSLPLKWLRYSPICLNHFLPSCSLPRTLLNDPTGNITRQWKKTTRRVLLSTSILPLRDRLSKDLIAQTAYLGTPSLSVLHSAWAVASPIALRHLL
jgi:hypothetical protein